MNRSEAEAYARTWIGHWNARDLDAVLASFEPEATFRSPKAVGIVGTPELRNRDELRDYWTRALERIASIRFELDHAAWDDRNRELCIVYVAELDGTRARAIERLRFSERGRVLDGEGFYGAPL
jgi:hypothetical protein